MILIVNIKDLTDITRFENKGNIMLTEINWIQEIEKLLSPSQELLYALLLVLSLASILWNLIKLIDPDSKHNRHYNIKK